ncbi:alpha/beta hydrolase [Guggenheimella bovis]
MKIDTTNLQSGGVLTSYLFDKKTEDENWKPVKRPALLILPGGSYMYVSKREGEPVALHFLMEGYQVFVLKYRTGEESIYPNPLIDVKEAMEYILKNSQEFSVDTEKIAIMGFSAGGHLALVYQSSEYIKAKATVSIYPIAAFGEMIKAYGEIDYDVEFPIGAMISNYEEEKDPEKLIKKDNPPLFIAYLKDDELIPSYTTSHYVTELLKAGCDVEAHLFRKGLHGLSEGTGLSNHSRNVDRDFSLWVPLCKNWLRGILEFQL